MRFSLRELSEAQANPRTFRATLREKGGFSHPWSYSYYLALVNAIHYFHNNKNDRIEGELYLENQLSRFVNYKRKEYVKDQLDWYISDYLSKKITTYKVKFNIQLPIRVPLTKDVIISGQINRIDRISPNTYIAWIFRNRPSDGWIGELSMPLIQNELAINRLNTSKNAVSVGIYSFLERKIEQHCYTNTEIDTALTQLDGLLQYLGLTQN